MKRRRAPRNMGRGDPIASCARQTRTGDGSYPVARNHQKGSGSDKFCLAVLAWANGTSRRARGRAGEKVVRRLRLFGPPLKENEVSILKNPSGDVRSEPHLCL